MELSSEAVSQHEILRRQVEHEDNLVIQRLNWLLVSQGFLFVAYSQILTSEKVASKLLPLLVIGTFSLMVTVFTLVGLFAAFNALRNLHEMIDQAIISTRSSSDEHEKAEVRVKLVRQPGGTRVIYKGISLRWIGAWYASGKSAAIGIVASLLMTWISLIIWTLVSVR